MMGYTPEQVFQFSSPEWEQQPLFDVEQKVEASDSHVRVHLTIDVEMADFGDARVFVGRMHSTTHELALSVDRFEHRVVEGGV